MAIISTSKTMTQHSDKIIGCVLCVVFIVLVCLGVWVLVDDTINGPSAYMPEPIVVVLCAFVLLIGLIEGITMLINIIKNIIKK